MGSTPSSAAATRDSRLRRPKYTSCVIDTREWPSWSAIMRAVAPASSKTVAVVFRQEWKVIHSSKPCRSRASTSQRVTVRGSRNVPFTVPKTGSSAPTPTARRLSSKITHHSGSCKTRSPACDFVPFRTNPCPVTLIKVDVTRSTPRSRSTSRHNTANASPIRRPVASRNADRSNKSCRTAI